MTDTTTGPRVPQLRATVTGETYGGQYWTSEEFEVTLDAPADPENLEGPFVLNLCTSSGHSVDRVNLTRSQATQVIAVAAQSATETLVDGIPGLARVTTWTLGHDMSDHVVLNDGHLDEIAAWLRYALGIEDWDYTLGIDWEY